RRDKTRCDGARPCGGCTRKRVQCLDGCDPCRRARARCEKTGGDSCARCDLKELICTEDAQGAPPPPRASPPAAERVKTACQGCKNDNKKCDDQRPCARCVARSEMCVPLPARARKNTKTRCEACRKGNFRCDDARPCPNCVSAGIECVNPARKGPGCGTRVRAACIHCRRNKVRCDGERPCAGCTRRGWECQEQGTRGVVASTSHAESTSPQPSASAMPPPSDPSMFAVLSYPTNPFPSSNPLPTAPPPADASPS
ncbi:hypothetical protein DFH08DRAFT_707408, partial [Mycena albidolilacea]